MRNSHVLLLCILGYALVSVVTCSSGIGPDDCCFTPYPRRLNKKFISSYFMTDHRCPMPGAILVTKKSRHICVDPSQPWVVNIMKYVDESTF